MAKSQTRSMRSISMSKHLHDRLKAHADKTGEPIAQIVDRLVNRHLDRLGVKP